MGGCTLVARIKMSAFRRPLWERVKTNIERVSAAFFTKFVTEKQMNRERERIRTHSWVRRKPYDS